MDKAIKYDIAKISGIEMPYAVISCENVEPSKELVIIPGLSAKLVTPIAPAVGDVYGTFLESCTSSAVANIFSALCNKIGCRNL